MGTDQLERRQTLVYTCNLCGSRCEAPPEELERETFSECGAITRWRALMHSLSMELFGEAMVIKDFPHRPNLVGMGMSDHRRYADTLAEKFNFTTTYYHREPRLDIANPPATLHGTLDFLISSDVFEHVEPPVQRAFQGSYRLLKPGGFLLMTVPTAFVGEETNEFFPSLREWEIMDFKGKPVLINKTADRRWEVFDDLEFHGGEGALLAMRVFSRASLLRSLRDAGFTEITEWTQPCPEFGIPEPRSGTPLPGWPVVARRD